MDPNEPTVRIDSAHEARTPDGWRVEGGLTMQEVEVMLDRLEAAGVAAREVDLLTDGTFQIRWRGD